MHVVDGKGSSDRQCELVSRWVISQVYAGVAEQGAGSLLTILLDLIVSVGVG